MTIRVKMLILIFAVVFVAAGASTLISRAISMNTVEDQIGDLLTTTAQSKAHQIERSLAEKLDTAVAISQVIASVVSDEAYRDETGGSLEGSFLQYVLDQFKEADELIYDTMAWDDSGKLLAATFHTDNFASSIAAKDLFEHGMQGAYITGVHPLDETGEYGLYVSVPIVIDNRTVGVLGLVNNAADIFQIATERTGLGETGEAYVVNRDGFMITPSRFVDDAILDRQLDASQFATDLDEAPAADEAGYTSGAVSSRNYLDSKVLRAYTVMPEMGWAVVVEKGSSEAFNPVARMTDTMLWILFALLGVGALGAFLLSRTITKPIVNLHQGVLQIMNGNLNHNVGAHGKDEIAQLSRAFDEMTANVKRSQEVLEEYSTGLEVMVDDRTKELSQANVHLTEAMEQLKSSQAQLLQSEKLAAVGQLVSGVAHELNNPLMAISGYTELMLMYLEEEQARDDLHSLHDLTKRATAVVKNLLSFARKQDPKREYISVNEALASVIKLRGYELKVDLIQIETQLDEELPCAMADFQQLQQVFLNIVVNAEQAMKQANGRGRLVVRTRRIGETIQVLFTDDGPGMPDEIKKRIFEPFFTTKEVGKGTGLGLSICYGIIQEHGGQIVVESRDGEGTTFIIELPVVVEAMEPAGEA